LAALKTALPTQTTIELSVYAGRFEGWFGYSFA